MGIPHLGPMGGGLTVEKKCRDKKLTFLGFSCFSVFASLVTMVGPHSKNMFFGPKCWQALWVAVVSFKKSHRKVLPAGAKRLENAKNSAFCAIFALQIGVFGVSG